MKRMIFVALLGFALAVSGCSDDSNGSSNSQGPNNPSEDASGSDASGEDASGEDASGEDASDEDASSEDASNEDANGDGSGILDQPLQGLINGEPWTYTFGESALDGDQYEMRLYANSGTGCDSFEIGWDGPDKRHISGYLPSTVGEHSLDDLPGGAVVMQYDEDNDDSFEFEYTDQGVIRIDEITDDVIKGGMAVGNSSDFEINGTFEIPVCDSLW